MCHVLHSGVWVCRPAVWKIFYTHYTETVNASFHFTADRKNWSDALTANTAQWQIADEKCSRCKYCGHFYVDWLLHFVHFLAKHYFIFYRALLLRRQLRFCALWWIKFFRNEAKKCKNVGAEKAKIHLGEMRLWWTLIPYTWVLNMFTRPANECTKNFYSSELNSRKSLWTSSERISHDTNDLKKSGLHASP